jgi:hypothetical protein
VVPHVTGSLAPPLRFGTPTPGELESVPVPSPAEALALRVRFLLFRERPRSPQAAPLDNRVRVALDLVTGERHLAPVLARGGLWLDGPATLALLALGSDELLADVAAALPSRVTVKVACVNERALAEALGFERAPREAESVALLIRVDEPGASKPRPSGSPSPSIVPTPEGKQAPSSAPVEGLELALELASSERAPRASAAEAPRPPSRRSDQERRLARTIEARARPPGHAREELLGLAPRPREPLFSVLVPSPFPSSATSWVAIVVELAPPPVRSDPGARTHEARVTQLAGDLAAERFRAERRETPIAPFPLHTVDRRPLDVEAARAEIPEWPRRALLVLAAGLDASLLREAALATEPPVFTDVVREVERAFARRDARAAAALALGSVAAPAIAEARHLRWELDLATLEALLAPGNRGATRPLIERKVGAAFETELATEPGRRLSRARQVADHEEAERLVIERNLLALEDQRAGVRILAARWLDAAHPGLEGYDPLGPFEERRAAVDRLWANHAKEVGP